MNVFLLWNKHNFLFRQFAQKRSLLFLFLLSLWTISMAQDRNLKTADKFFAEGSFLRAIPYYQKALKKGFDFPAMRGLAASYRQVRDFEQAEKWYGYVVNTRYAKAEDHLYYGQVLMRRRRYEQAEDQFTRFAELSPEDERAARYIDACRRYQRALPKEVRYEIAALPFNSPQSDFAAIPYKNGLLYSSARIKDKIVERRSDRDGNPFLDLWYAERRDSLNWENPRLLKGKFNTRFHEAAPAFDPATQTFFFTRNNYEKRKVRSSRSGMVKLKIFFATLATGGDWSNLEALPFNSEEHSAGHPTLTQDGQLLFFSSDMPGGYGGTDIWYSARTDSGWAVPINLGPLVNTVGDELFPQMQPDGKLFFSSNGHGGQGGLDIYLARATARGWGDIRHLPAPINSPADDFGYVLTPDGQSGYFSSDRPGGRGMDDLWSFRILNPTFQGQVVRAADNVPLSDAIVTLIDLENGERERAISTAEGRFGFVLQPSRNYKVRIVRDGYVAQTMPLNTQGTNATRRQDETVALGQPALVLDGVVHDQKTGHALPGVEVRITPGDAVLMSGDGGTFNFELQPGRTYTLEAQRYGFQPAMTTITTDGSPRTKRMQANLELVPNPAQMQLRGQVLDRDNQPLANAELFLVDKSAKEESEQRSGPDGYFSFPLQPNRDYELVARRFGYRAAQQQFSSPGRRRQMVPLKVYMDLPGVGKSTELRDIYYDYGASYLRDEAAQELQRLHKFLTMHPQVQVEIASHTDARGSAASNLRLSQKRADAVAKYLIYLGTDPARIVPRGYGESRLKNDCGDGKNCSEAAHQENRRTEFMILREAAGNAGKPSGRPVLMNGSTEVPPTTLSNPRPSNRDGDFPPLDIEKPVCYRVQIGVHDGPRKQAVMEQLAELVAVLHVIPVDTALYRYQLGKCGTYQEVEELHRLAEGHGFSEAFIVAYQEGKRVALPREMEK